LGWSLFALLPVALLLLGCTGGRFGQDSTGWSPAAAGASRINTGQRINQGSTFAAVDNILTVSDTRGFAVGQTLQIDGEQVQITSINGNDLRVSRGFNGTRAQDHADRTAIQSLGDQLVVYIGTKQGEIKALSDRGGEGSQLLWTFKPAGTTKEEEKWGIFGVYNTPAVGKDLVYVSGINGVLYAIDKESGPVGDTGWQRPEGPPEDLPSLVSGPAVDLDANVVVVGSENGNLYAYDATTGEPRKGFPFKTRGKIWSTPVIHQGVVYFGSHDKNVYAVSLKDGRLKWKFPTGGAVAGRPLLLRDLVIAGSFDKMLYAINIKDGRKAWQFQGNNWFWTGAVSDGRTIFAPSMDGNVYALDRGGNLLWKHDVGSAIVSRPVLMPRGLVVAGKDGKISVLDTSPSDVGLQRVLSARPLRDTEIRAPLASSGGSVYVGAQDSTVRRIEIRADQREMWCFNTGDDPQCQ
jgi:outer membrane protein assembly factor BamB